MSNDYGRRGDTFSRHRRQSTCSFRNTSRKSFQNVGAAVGWNGEAELGKSKWSKEEKNDTASKPMELYILRIAHQPANAAGHPNPKIVVSPCFLQARTLQYLREAPAGRDHGHPSPSFIDGAP